jgi:hypothetical protein
VPPFWTHIKRNIASRQNSIIAIFSFFSDKSFRSEGRYRIIIPSNITLSRIGLGCEHPPYTYLGSAPADKSTDGRRALADDVPEINSESSLVPRIFKDSGSWPVQSKTGSARKMSDKILRGQPVISNHFQGSLGSSPKFGFCRVPRKSAFFHSASEEFFEVERYSLRGDPINGSAEFVSKHACRLSWAVATDQTQSEVSQFVVMSPTGSVEF